MIFDSTITMGNAITAGTMAVGFVFAWARMESTQKVTQEKLDEVSDRHATEVAETKRQLGEIASKHEAEAIANVAHRERVAESLHQTALLNQATSLTLNSIVKDVNRIDRELEKLRERQTL